MRLMRVFTQKRGGLVVILAEYKSAEGKRVKRLVGSGKPGEEIHQLVELVAVPNKK